MNSSSPALPWLERKLIMPGLTVAVDGAQSSLNRTHFPKNGLRLVNSYVFSDQIGFIATLL